MRRRDFLAGVATTAAALGLAPHLIAASGPEIAITMDDPQTTDTQSMPGEVLNRSILEQLRAARLRIALFVTGMRIDTPAGASLLKSWDDAGHLICNHSYSHLNYNSEKVPYERFAADFQKNEPLITGYRHFTRMFRFPFLKEGDTADKRDRFRALLHEHRYRTGHVTVDASDWYIDDRLRARLQKDPKADTSGYRDYYVAHIRDRAKYYRELARDVLGRDIRHTVLMHHRLLNAMFLGDVIAGLRQDGWKVVGAARAFGDPVLRREPQTVPAGESLIWALAKESGRFEGKLRYPGEDDVYEKPKMDALGL